MPCFKGLAVSIHTPDGPISEYSIQRQSRASRIACYIPVPPPKLPDSGSGRPEQSTFAISITLLNPGQDVPYSTPKATPDNPAPRPKIVGGLPGPTEMRGHYSSMVIPYKPLTNSPNETVAAYIYFDGRQKEEVATLLRRGEETWVNSRWVSVPDSEGGGLAEREFLFREVGLERWLNGLDLDGKDAAAKIERRRQKMEKRRLKRNEIGGMDTDAKSQKERDIMRYGNDSKSPLEDVSDEDMSFSDSDDDPIPESAGQIKVALFRVLASGEVKRGEYSPQFDAHDDDDDVSGGNDNSGASDANVDHTTSFAKPKTLDPKTISTQTVTSIDATDKPYATFTFMYRGERQLQKMGILKDAKVQETPGSAKRRSIQPDFSNLGPLKPGGTVGFLNFRENTENNRRGKKKNAGDDDMDSDDDDDNSILGKADAEEGKDDDVHLSPEELKQQGELAESIRKIKLKRQHSSASLATNTPPTDTGSPRAAGDTAPSSNLSTTPPIVPPSTAATEVPKPATNTVDGEFVGSPLKKQRASVSQADEDVMRRRMESGLSHEITNNDAPQPAVNAATTTNAAGAANHPPHDSMATEEEEL